MCEEKQAMRSFVAYYFVLVFQRSEHVGKRANEKCALAKRNYLSFDETEQF